MTDFVSKTDSIQPERSASRVIAFCLDLHQTEVACARCVTVAAVRSYRTISPLPRKTQASIHWRFISVALFRIFGSRRKWVAVSDRFALWCPDFPHFRLRLESATIPPAFPLFN